MLNTNPWIYDIVASIQVPEHDPHAQQVDKDAMQAIIKDEGKTIVPPAKVKASVGPELERWKLAAEAEMTTLSIRVLSITLLLKRSDSTGNHCPHCASGQNRSRRIITSVGLVCAVTLSKWIPPSRAGPPELSHHLC